MENSNIESETYSQMNIDDYSHDEEKNNSSGTLTMNKPHRIWTKEEDALLLKTSEKYGVRNWKAIAKQIQDRTFIQCAARYKRIRPGIVKGSWVNNLLII
jgi:hypothetical protein